MKYLLTILIVITSTCIEVNGQENTGCNHVYEKADKDPQYKNGQQDLLDFICNDLMRTLSKCIYNIEDAPTRLLIDLTIDENGNVMEVSYKRSDLSKPCEIQLTEQLMKMKGWIPGKVDGRSVCSKFHMPIGCIKWDE